MRKITAAALFRSRLPLVHVADIPSQHGTFNGMTSDLSSERGGDPLYIIWQSVLAV